MNEINDFFEDELDIDDRSITENDCSDIILNTVDWTIETIANQIFKENINLRPNFQRRDVWNNKQRSELFESIILHYPIPQIILADDPNNPGKYLVIDGKQRLTSIQYLYFDSEICKIEEYKNKALILSSLEILKKLNGKKYSELDDYKHKIDNYTIKCIIVKNLKYCHKCDVVLRKIFYRLNTGGTNLIGQELRQAMFPGEFLTFLDKETSVSSSFAKIFEKGPDRRMNDVELALRHYAFKFHIDKLTDSLNSFLDITCKEFNSTWKKYREKNINEFKELENAIECTLNIFGKDSFRRYTFNEDGKCVSKRFSKSVFELFSVYLSDEKVRSAICEHSDEFKEDFIKLCSKPDFADSIKSSTSSIKNIKIRHLCFIKLINKYLLNKISYNLFE